MGEAEAGVFELEYAVADGGVEPLVDGDSVAVCCRDQFYCRPCECGRQKDDIGGLGRKPGETTA